MSRSAMNALGVALGFAALAALLPNKQQPYVPKTEWVTPLEPKSPPAKGRVLH